MKLRPEQLDRDGLIDAVRQILDGHGRSAVVDAVLSEILRRHTALRASAAPR